MKKEPFKPNNFYHIRNTANNEENLFYEHKNYTYFLMLLQRHISKIAKLHAYCFLEDSFDLLVLIKPNNEIPDEYKQKMHLPFSHCFNAYTKAFNKMYGRSGSLFREHFHREVIDGKSLSKLVDHIHLLPVKKRKAKTASEFPYSSAIQK